MVNMTANRGARLEQAFRDAGKKPFVALRGKYVTVTFLMAVSDDEYLVSIDQGAIREVRSGPLLTPSYAFGVRASKETWEAFWSPRPGPGMNDILGLLKKRLIKFEGNLHPLMSNLFYFKELLASPRYQ